MHTSLFLMTTAFHGLWRIWPPFSGMFIMHLPNALVQSRQTLSAAFSSKASPHQCHFVHTMRFYFSIWFILISFVFISSLFCHLCVRGVWNACCAVVSHVSLCPDNQPMQTISMPAEVFVTARGLVGPVVSVYIFYLECGWPYAMAFATFNTHEQSQKFLHKMNFYLIWTNVSRLLCSASTEKIYLCGWLFFCCSLSVCEPFLRLLPFPQSAFSCAYELHTPW